MIKAAVVGLGWWGQKLVHDLAGSEDVRVVFGVDPIAAHRDLVKSLGIATSDCFTDALIQEGIDAVLLCTPHQMHVDQIVAASSAGKHVFCEKPLATATQDAIRALDAIALAGVQLGVGHERRFEPAVVRMLDACRSGEIGRPIVMEGNFSQDKFLDLSADNWRLSESAAPVGPLSATGIHLVDLAISIFGRPTEVLARLSTQATSFANGDTLTITMGFEEGRTALMTAILTTPFVGRVQVFGSNGWMEIRDRNHPEDPQGWDVTTSVRGTAPKTEFWPPHPSVRHNIEEWARACEGRTTYSVPVADMLYTVQAFDAATRSAYSGKLEAIK